MDSEKQLAVTADRTTRRAGRSAGSTCGVERLEHRRLCAAGDLDPTFGTGGVRAIGASGRIVDVEVAAGKTYVAAIGSIPGDVVDGEQTYQQVSTITRLDAAGKLDKTFGEGGRATLEPFTDVVGIAVQPDGKVVATGANIRSVYDRPQGLVTRLLKDGSPDYDFGDIDAPDPYLPATVSLPIQNPSAPRLAPDGRIVVGGGVGEHYTSRFAAVRLGKNGAFDASFGTTGVVVLPTVGGEATHVALQKDGKILLGGRYDDTDTDDGARVVRLSNDGRRDATYHYDSGALGDADVLGDLEVGPDGSAYIAVTYFAGSQGMVAPYRLSQTDGSVARAYELFGVYGTYGDTGATAVRVATDGKLVVFGAQAIPDYFNRDEGRPQVASLVARYDPDGSLDLTFGAVGYVTTQPTATADIGGDRTFGTLRPNNAIVLAQHATTAPGSAIQVQQRSYGPGSPTGVALASNGFLGVEGTAGRDTITVTAAGSNVRVQSRGVVSLFPKARVKRIFVGANGGDDAVTLDAFGLPSSVDAGDGADKVTTRGGGFVRGGRGSDVIDVGGGTLVDGEQASAWLNEGELPPDPAVDILSFASRSSALNVIATPGSLDEYTLGVTARGVEVVVGGSGNDTMKVAVDPWDPTALNPAVHFIGGPGNDLLVGGNNDDILEGGTGKDRLYGMAGNDLLLGKDGVADYLDGGADKDTAYRDAIDALFGVEVVR